MDGEAVAFFLLDLGNMRTTILLLMHDPAKELLEDYTHGGTEEVSHHHY